MPNEALNKDKFIAQELSPFIFDLCKWGLNNIGVALEEGDDYYIKKTIIQEQALNEENWNQIWMPLYLFHKESELTFPYLLKYINTPELISKISTFTEPILNKVLLSHKGNFLIKTLKRSYLDSLTNQFIENKNKRKILQSSVNEKGFSKLEKPEVQKNHPIDALSKKNKNLKNKQEIKKTKKSKTENETEQVLIEILDVQKEYLDNLKSLPFLLEKYYLNNSLLGVNYDPNKTAELLVESLKLINDALGKNETKLDEYILNGLKTVITIYQIGTNVIASEALDFLEKSVLPVVKDIIKSSKKLEEKKKNFIYLNLLEQEDIKFPNKEINPLQDQHSEIIKARELMLKNIGIGVNSIKDIVANTLLTPALKMRQMFGGISNTLFSGYKIVNEFTQNKDSNVIEITSRMIDLFSMDKAATEIEEALGQSTKFTTKIKEIKGKFTQFTKEITSKLDLSKWLNLLQTNTNLLETQKHLSYLAFYNLSIRSQISNGFETSFLLYQDEAMKANPKFNTDTEFSYTNYQNYIKTIPQNIKRPNSEEILSISQYLELPLDELLNDYLASLDFLKDENVDKPNDVFEISHEHRLNLDTNNNFLLIFLLNRLNSLNHDLRRPELSPLETGVLRALYILDLKLDQLAATISEMSKAEVMIKKLLVNNDKNTPTLDLFLGKFLNPTKQEMINRYNQERLYIILEKMIDIPREPLPTSSNKKTKRIQSQFITYLKDIRQIYTKVGLNKPLCKKEIALIEKQWKNLCEFTDQSIYQLSTSDETIMSALKNLASTEKPEEILEENLEKTLTEKIIADTPSLDFILDSSLDWMTTEAKRGDALKKISKESGNKDLENLAQLKLDYVNSIQTLLYQAKNNLEMRAKLTVALTRCASGEIPHNLMPEVSLFSAFDKFFRFAWNEFPTKISFKTIDSNMLAKAFQYVFEDSLLIEVLNTKEKYYKAIEQNPIAALIQDLRDPLTLIPPNPVLEKITNKVSNFIVTGIGKFAKNTGYDFFRKIISNLPFGGIANNLLDLPPIKLLINNATEKLVGSGTKEVASQVIKETISGLSSLVGVKIPFQMQKIAWEFASGINNKNDAMESFSIYYLQYRAMMPNPKNEQENKTIIAHLFSGYLENENKEKTSKKIDDLSKKFSELDQKFKLPKLIEISDNSLEENATQFLQFLMTNVNLLIKEEEKEEKNTIIQGVNSQKPTYDKIRKEIIHREDTNTRLIDNKQSTNNKFKSVEINEDKIQKAREPKSNEGVFKLILVNQLFLMIARAQHTAASQKLLTLQENALINLSNILKQEENSDNKKIFLDSANQFKTLQFHTLKGQIETLDSLVTSESQRVQALLAGNKSHPILGLTLAEYYYSNFTGTPKLYLTYAFYDVVSFISTWSLIALPVFLTVSGPFLMTFFGTIAASRILTKFASTIWERRAEFNQAGKETSFLTRIFRQSLLVFKSLGIALIKTLITDRVLSLINKYLSPIKQLSKYFKTWPTEDRGIQEVEAFKNLKASLKNLDHCLKTETESTNSLPKGIEGVFTSAKNLKTALQQVRGQIKATKLVLNTVPTNDVRFHIEEYGLRLEKMKKGLKLLDHTIQVLEKYLEPFDTPVLKSEAFIANLSINQEVNTPSSENILNQPYTLNPKKVENIDHKKTILLDKEFPPFHMNAHSISEYLKEEYKTRVENLEKNSLSINPQISQPSQDSESTNLVQAPSENQSFFKRLFSWFHKENVSDVNSQESTNLKSSGSIESKNSSSTTSDILKIIKDSEQELLKSDGYKEDNTHSDYSTDIEIEEDYFTKDIDEKNNEKDQASSKARTVHETLIKNNDRLFKTNYKRSKIYQEKNPNEPNKTSKSLSEMNESSVSEDKKARTFEQGNTRN